jgi:hypothetical protein
MKIQKSSLSHMPKEFAMARPVQPYFIPSGAGDANPAMSTRAPGGTQDGSRTLAGMLLAAVVAALMVVADQLIETWADGHLLVVWVALWTVAFAALALLAPPLRQLSASLAAEAARWARLNAVRRDEAQLWDLAQHDHRVMRDLQMAKLYSEGERA